MSIKEFEKDFVRSKEDIISEVNKLGLSIKIRKIVGVTTMLIFIFCWIFGLVCWEIYFGILSILVFILQVRDLQKINYWSLVYRITFLNKKVRSK